MRMIREQREPSWWTSQPVGISTVPPLARNEEVGLRKKNGALGTALPSSLACSLQQKKRSAVFLFCVQVRSCLKLRPMATILRPVDKKFRAAMRNKRVPTAELLTLSGRGRGNQERSLSGPHWIRNAEENKQLPMADIDVRTAGKPPVELDSAIVV